MRTGHACPTCKRHGAAAQGDGDLLGWLIFILETWAVNELGRMQPDAAELYRMLVAASGDEKRPLGQLIAALHHLRHKGIARRDRFGRWRKA